MQPRGSDDRVGDEPSIFYSLLELRRGSWRQFVTEILTLAVVTTSLTLGGLGWAQWRGEREVVVLGALGTAWCLYVAGSAVTSLRRGRRMFASRFPTLRLDEMGVGVRHPFGNVDGAFLAWADCAAVVVSPMPTVGRCRQSYRAYVEFVPVAPDRVEGDPRPRDQRCLLLERPADEVRTVWLELAGVGRTAAEVSAWLREQRPSLTVIDSLQRHSARTL